MAAYPLNKCQVTAAGLEGDRLVMVVKIFDNKTYKPVVATQRTLPQLSLIKAHLNGKNGVTLSIEGCGPLLLDIAQEENKNTLLIDLHSIKAPCVDLGDEAAEWIQNALAQLKAFKTAPSGYEYRLFTLARDELRKVADSPANLLIEDARSYDATYLSDLAPMTLTSHASLNALNQAAAESVPMDRFRTNIVVTLDNPLAFLEDHVQTFQIGDSLKLRSMGPTFRCVIPTVDQTTGEAGFRKNIRSAEPIATLKAARSGGLRFGVTGLLPVGEGGSKSFAPLFGIYLGVENSHTSGEVTVGDPIRVMEYKTEEPAELVVQLSEIGAILLGFATHLTSDPAGLVASLSEIGSIVVGQITYFFKC